MIHFFFFPRKRRHTSCALVTGVQTCTLPICETVYSIDPAKHPMASYYRNIIAHHFLDRAMIELALFELRDADRGDATAAFWAKIDRLRDLFKFEFFYPPRDEHRAAIEAELARIDPV